VEVPLQAWYGRGTGGRLSHDEGVIGSKPHRASPAGSRTRSPRPSFNNRGDHAVNKAQAQTAAHKWIAPFNDHDLETILSHYAESVALTSLLVTKVLGDPAGTVRSNGRRCAPRTRLNDSTKNSAAA
jgi:hypothetical protein